MSGLNVLTEIELHYIVLGSEYTCIDPISDRMFCFTPEYDFWVHSPNTTKFKSNMLNGAYKGALLNLADITNSRFSVYDLYVPLSFQT